MKLTFLSTLLALILLAGNSFAQIDKEQSKELSNAEKFYERSGSLYKKEFITIGAVKNCLLQVMLLQDMITGEEKKAVRFEYNYTSSGSSDTKIAVLDPDEVDGLIKSIKIIQEKILPVPPENYTEVTFRSRGGFEAGCFKDKRNKDWAAYLKLERFDGRSYVILNKEEFGELATLLEESKKALK